MVSTATAFAADGSHLQRRLESLINPVGYYTLHPDVSLNYQMNRFSTGETDMIDEMRDVAPRIHDYTDYTREFVGLARRALDSGRKLEGALYLRSAEFFMFGDDPRKQTTRRTYIQLMAEVYGFEDRDRFEIPYETGALSAFRSTPHQVSRGTIVVSGGFDGYNEDSFPMLRYFSGAGYDIIRFEGPGQGVALEDHHLSMTHDWHKPVKAILDYFNLKDVTLIGGSLGGCLAIRAAAYEPRVRRVVADDILTNFFDVQIQQVKPPARQELTSLLDVRADHVVNNLLERAMKGSLVTEWGINQGMRVIGASTPSAFLHELRNYRTDDVSALVKQDVLLLVGAEDHFIPVGQFYDQIRSLTRARSLTARLFTRLEQAHEHIQIGNLGLQYRVIRDWLELLRERDAASG